MKVELLKNLIKEAVREVIKEELLNINLKEVELKKSQIVNNLPVNSDQVNSVPSSINEVLNLTRASMTREDYKNIVGTEQSITETSAPVLTSGGGLDLSNLDFVKNAAAIYNLSKTKR
jgi:hypothetical protein